ncbi:hypothetical protein [Pleionea sediminis]|uniref:hypothetical protein n=1 Tax=Pleionea sediminis TaxID=2569479 RepID=UPI00118478F4|nr:hypothetical protein [Pleionea sediminis]
MQADASIDNSKDWGIIVHSVGTTNANVIGALHKAIPVPENQIARKIYQAPSMLLNQISQGMADEISVLLNKIGLQTEAIHKSKSIEEAKALFDVCLVLNDKKQMPQILEVLKLFLGVQEDQCKSMLFQSPNVIMGQVSRATVEAIRDRFSELNVDVKASRISNSNYLFLYYNLTGHEKHQLKSILTPHNLQHLLENNAFLEQTLTRSQADKIWPHVKRFGSKVKLINADFAQFDVQLELSEKNNGLLNILEQHTDIPTHLLSKVIDRAPIVIKRNASFNSTLELTNTLNDNRSKFTVLPVSMQYFNIAISKMGQREVTEDIIAWMTGCTQEQLKELCSGRKSDSLLLTATQAHWLAHELKLVGTHINLILA